MAGSTEDRHNDLARRIAELEARRADQLLVLETEARCDQDTAEAEAVLQAIETELAALRVRLGSFDSDPRNP